MTFIGRILVIIITACSMLFLAGSVIVFTTARNWKEAYDQKQADLSDLNTEKRELTTALDNLRAETAQTTQELQNQIAVRDGTVRNLEESIQRLRASRDNIQQQLAVAIEQTKGALDEVGVRREETNELNEQIRTLQGEVEEYQIQLTDLNSQIEEMERNLATISSQNDELNARVLDYLALLQQNDVTVDISQVRDTPLPSDLPDGRVLAVQDDLVQISLGENEGLVRGHLLQIYRLDPRPQYVGELRIETVEPNRAIASVVRTYRGAKVASGDTVSGQITVK